MRSHRLTVLAGALAWALPCAAQTPYDSVYDQLKDLAPRADAVAPIHGLVLHRDVLQLRFESGNAYLLTPVAGRTVGIALVGVGSMSFVPPLTVEQYNLKRVMGDSVLTEPITAAVLLFTDSTQAALARSLRFAPPSAISTSDADATGPVHDALDYLIDGHTHRIDESFVGPILDQTTTEFFSAFIQRAHGESVLMEFDPNASEEVLLYRRGHMPGQRVETVCQFQRAGDLDHGISMSTKHADPMFVDAYDIDATIDHNYNFKAAVNARVIARRARERWIPFRLYGELDVDSVRTSAGVPLTYYRRDHASPLWVQFAKPLGAGDTANVRVVYHGDVIGFGSTIEQYLPPWWDKRRQDIVPILDRWAFIKETETWFPRYGDEEPASFTLTFHTPKDLKFATIGRMIAADTAEDVVTTHWVSELPTDQVSFNIGKFDEWVVRDPRIPPVTVQVNTEAHAVIGRLIPSARNPEAEVGADVVNSLAFFSNVYGPPLFHQYYATEIPYFHGQAFPGMIHLSWATYLSRSQPGNDEAFRAHEMAHQWWGIGVEPANYRDAWLAEGFAEFSALWYMQTILNDNQKYLKKLRDSRGAIRRAREKSAPLGLGYRAAESWRGAYELTTYQKGAWVLQMLRNMMLDTRTMSEERFSNMMHDFYMTYRGRRASTVDFQHTVELAIGQNMDWFFDEWVYGTGIPTYTFSWTAGRDSAGMVAHLRVRQSDVPSDFAMYVPVLIKLTEGDVIIRILVRGDTTNFTVRLPGEPVSMELNPLESVLAEVKTEGWHP